MNFFKRYSLTNLIANSRFHPGRAGYDLFHARPHLLFILASLTLLLFLLVSPLLAQQAPDANVEFFIKSPEPGTPLTIGDQITLRLEITHPVGSRVVLPQLEPQWEAFEIINQTAPETIDNDNGTETTGKDIVVTLFQPGQYETPPLVVTHRQPDGTLEELASPIIPLNVTSVLTEDLELRDIKPQAELPLPPLWPRVLAALALTMFLTGLLFVIGLLLYHRWRKGAIPELVPAPFMDSRPPEVIAHAELDRIETLNLPAQNLIKEHYSLVAICLRAYIQGRYQIPAPEQTTSELRNAFGQVTLPARDVAGFMGLLSESDLVKFARYIPQADNVTQLINKARTIVDATTPVPELATTEAEPETEVMA